MTLDYILKKYNIKTDHIEIPNVGRDDLADLCRELNFKRGVEIGVADGDYSEILMRKNPQMKLYGVDPYKPYRGYKDYTRKNTFEGMLEHAHDKLDKYPKYIFVKEFSREAANLFPNDFFDCAYIDGNHEGKYVKEDIEIWTKKVRKDGIVAGHDFTGRWPSLRKVVIEYAKKNNRQLFVLGMERKDLGLYCDTSRSWLFVR